MRTITLCCSLLLTTLSTGPLLAADDDSELPVVASDDFEEGAEQWEMLDPGSWRVSEADGAHTLEQFVKEPSYEPPHRSPFHVALLKGPIVGDFELTLRVRSTHEDYPHRDACLFFGYQDAEHFYYVHLGKAADPHCNQIFVVDGSPRTKITKKEHPGTNWSDSWHEVKIVRRVADGTIEVYFDDMEQPAMTAKDKRFTWGRIGVGSFDDTAEFDDVVLRGVTHREARRYHIQRPSAFSRRAPEGRFFFPRPELSPRR